MAKNGRNTFFTRGQDSILTCEARHGLSIESVAGKIVPQRMDFEERRLIKMIDQERSEKRKANF